MQLTQIFIISLPRVQKTFSMTSQGLGEMLKGDFADPCTENFPPMLMGDKQHLKPAQKGTEDPHQCEESHNISRSLLF